MVKGISKYGGQLFVLGVISVLLLPTLLQRGMFLDGVTYASISSMLADGIGAYHAPFYTHFLGAVFYDQLPGGFIVESWLFDLIGQHFWVERLYCIIILSLTIWGIYRLSKVFFDQRLSLAWIVLLYITVPITFWSYREHVLEVGMTACTVWAVYFGLRSIKYQKATSAIACGLLTALAIMSKGPTGAFPLAAPLLYVVVVDRRSGHWWLTILPAITILIVAIGLYQVPSIAIFVDNYLDKQLLPSLAGEREITTQYRIGILVDLLSEIAVPLGIGVLIYGLARKTSNLATQPRLNWRKLSFLLLVGASASLPLLLTLKQRRFYLLPSLPFYAMAIAYWSMPYLEVMATTLGDRGRQVIGAIGTALMIGAVGIMISNAGGYARDRELISDIETIGASIESNQIISADSEICKDWATHAYFARYARISLRCDTIGQHHVKKEGGRLVLLVQ